MSGTDVYAGGQFTTAGGASANHIAKWDGSAWSPIISGTINGVDDDVNAIAISGTNVYAGGNFTHAGGPSANYIAKWNGNSWSALTNGNNGLSLSVDAIAVTGTNVYAGGNFTTADGTTVNHIARWDGSQWNALSTGVNSTGEVLAMGVSGDDVYAGGYFNIAGTCNPCNRIARWDGSQWNSLGSGSNNGVNGISAKGLAVSGSNLYVGGIFDHAGGGSANQIAKWDGSSWSALGSGFGPPTEYPRAVAITGTDVYVGGDDDLAGGFSSTHFAIWWHAALVGHVSWQGRTVGSAAYVAPITLTLKLSTTELNFVQRDTDTHGFFTVPVYSTLSSGTYSWRVKGPDGVTHSNATDLPGFLANGGTVVLAGGSDAQEEMGTMKAGDANNDNIVNLSDFNIYRNSFGKSCGDSGFDKRADFNGDCVVNISDNGLLMNNYGSTGYAPN